MRTFDPGSKRRLRRLRWRRLTPPRVFLLLLAMLLAMTIGARWVQDWHEALHRYGGARSAGP